MTYWPICHIKPMAIQSINPATGKILKTYKPYSEKEILKKLTLSEQAFLFWSSLSFFQRGKYFKKLAACLRKNSALYAQTITLEMGKPITQSIAEVEKCAWVLDYFARNARNFLKDQVIATEYKKSYVRHDPLGVILGVMPWNFPFWQVFRAAAPILIGGNVFVVKHASNVTLSALLIEKIFAKNGFPRGVYTALLVESVKIKAVIENEIVKAVTVTGSEPAGKSVAQIAGFNLKKTVLELGGSDPFIILDDADVQIAAQTGVTARVINSGQSCIAAKRFIVTKKVSEKFLRFFVEKMKALNVGNPLLLNTQVGPLAREDLLFQLEKQVQNSVKLGAKILLGGKRIQRRGFYFEPTVITDLKKGMPAFDEELFGPVAAVFMVKDENEALKIANDSRFGLGASLWSKNLKKAQELAGKVEAGFVTINDMVKSDPRLPFGGIKKSGYGRELGIYGSHEFVNLKTVVVK